MSDGVEEHCTRHRLFVDTGASVFNNLDYLIRRTVVRPKAELLVEDDVLVLDGCPKSEVGKLLRDFTHARQQADSPMLLKKFRVIFGFGDENYCKLVNFHFVRHFLQFTNKNLLERCQCN